MDTEKFCKSCKICAQAKGEYQKPAGKLHLLPIATRPWKSINDLIYLSTKNIAMPKGRASKLVPYFMLNDVKRWWDLPKRVTMMSQRKQ